MHPYIPHLLDDIFAARRTEVAEVPADREISFEEEMEEIERWVDFEEPEHTFGYYCGLEVGNFPPPGQLTKKDMKLVIKAFQHMMFTWNSGIDMPANLPVALKYSSIVNTLNEKTTIVNSGFMTFDYCSGYAPDCVFKVYCSCMKFYNKNDGDETNDFPMSDAGELPF